MLNHEYTDSVFGEMIYRHCWQKIEKQKIVLLNKEFEVSVVAQAYTGEFVSEKQRQSYILLTDNLVHKLNSVSLKIVQYIDDNISSYVLEGVASADEKGMYSEVVIPKTLLFKQNGSVILLCDFKWDFEHGLGVDLSSLKIGAQDIFL